VVNPELHLQMHLVVVNQLWDDTPDHRGVDGPTA
jgi:hypothetical protein